MHITLAVLERLIVVIGLLVGPRPKPNPSADGFGFGTCYAEGETVCLGVRLYVYIF